MKTILITGATGNVGREVIRALHARGGAVIRAGMRDVARAAPDLAAFDGIELMVFDFADPHTYAPALAGCDALFLLRPPQVTDAFGKLVSQAKAAGVGHIVFLSVQGAENNRFIPHHKTEELLRRSGVPFTLLRPAYFTQNFTTTLHEDLARRHRVFVPAGRARFTLIDVRDIGDVAAVVFLDPGPRHHGQAYALTARYRLNFQQMVDQLSAGLGVPITYVSPSPWRFFWTKRRENLPTGFILIMTLLHYLPRFAAEPPLSPAVTKLLGREPTEFAQFVAENRAALL